MTFFDGIASHLSGRFQPLLATNAPTKATDRAVTLSSAITTQFGLKFNDSTLVATNHRNLTEGIRWTYATLDKFTGTRTETWAMKSERTEAEVLGLLSQAAATHPITPYDDVKAQFRPGVNKLLGRGKFRSAVACEAARVGYATGIGFAQALSRAMVGAANDVELLLALEEMPGEVNVKEIDWTLPAAWVDAATTYFEGDFASWMLTAYCRWLASDWSEMTDPSLLELVERVRAQRQSGPSKQERTVA